MKTGFIKYDSKVIDIYPDLSALEQIAYQRILNLSGEEGYSEPLSDMAYWLRSSEQTARRTLRRLVEIGVLQELKKNGKPTSYRPLTNCNPLQNVTPYKMEGDPLQIVTPNNIDIIDNEERVIINAREEVKPKRFSKPTPAEVQAYCDARANGINGEEFCDFYESKGWVVGKSPMKDWKAAVRTWERNHKKEKAYVNSTTGAAAAQSGTAQGKPYGRIQELANSKFNLD